MDLFSGSKFKALEIWRTGVLSDPQVNLELFPQVNTLSWPYGTKGSWVAPEEAMRHARVWKMYSRLMQQLKTDKNAHLIGEGIVAPPPCGGPPGCEFFEGRPETSVSSSIGPSNFTTTSAVAAAFLGLRESHTGIPASSSIVTPTPTAAAIAGSAFLGVRKGE
eukprot:TRINITY_DN55632_c0_g1_i1.p1 TRINITY_DN55632_c0_g1~~TRINITY_DN55632_c0_g1_i1.p1  ORF type:complete len:175 (+),score=23.67 TRINITY_DN55632_c0_g1_i1:38-526(+)